MTETLANTATAGNMIFVIKPCWWLFAASKMRDFEKWPSFFTKIELLF